MRSHEMRSIEWMAGAQGTGFVALCDCGWATGSHRDRDDALAEAGDHFLRARMNPPERARRWRLPVRRTTVVGVPALPAT